MHALTVCYRMYYCAFIIHDVSLFGCVFAYEYTILLTTYSILAYYTPLPSTLVCERQPDDAGGGVRTRAVHGAHQEDGRVPGKT